MNDFKQKIIKRASKYALDIINFTKRLNKEEYSLLVIVKQLIRSATSVGANIVEAQAACSKKDFINFLNHALKSANESAYWLSLLSDSQNLVLEQQVKLLEETKAIANILAASILTVKDKNKF